LGTLRSQNTSSSEQRIMSPAVARSTAFLLAPYEGNLSPRPKRAKSRTAGGRPSGPAFSSMVSRSFRRSLRSM